MTAFFRLSQETSDVMGRDRSNLRYPDNDRATGIYGDVRTGPHQILADKLTLFKSGKGQIMPAKRFVSTKFFDILKPLDPIRVKRANSTVNCPFFIHCLVIFIR